MSHFPHQYFGIGKTNQHEHEAAKKLADERDRAAAEMSVKYANLHMPEDIRSRAKAYGMEAWAEVLWNNAFQAGYREAIRDRAGLQPPKGE